MKIYLARPMNDSMYGNAHAREDTWRDYASLVAHVLGTRVVFIKEEALNKSAVSSMSVQLQDEETHSWQSAQSGVDGTEE
jgi:hypothetical protein